MKYKILKFFDVCGLQVFEPVVRLIYREEPLTQLKHIGLYIVVPTLVFGLFLLGWTLIAPIHKTKSGEVPTPAVVWDAYGGIVDFHEREYTKLSDFALGGQEREAELAKVEARLKEVGQQSQAVNARFAELESQRAKLLAIKLAPYEAAIAKQTAQYRAAQARRQQALDAKSQALAATDTAGKEELKRLVRQHIDQTTREQDHIKTLAAELNQMRSEKYSPLEVARKEKNALEQEQQFLLKRVSYLSDANREAKVIAGLKDIKAKEVAYATAQGPQLVALASDIVRTQERVEQIAASEYAKPPTFFDQIWTSLKCVFLGFVISTLIAIPIGILCGMSKVFMASMTPLISLFKPVSPIVWLPIVFIIVGGFIEVPEKAWLPPAFLSTAITVALCSLWPTLVNTALGVASIDRDHINVARVLRLGFWSRLFKIVIPSALPLIFTGMRISLGVGWMVLIAGELLASSPGLGKFVWDMFNNGSSETFAQMFVVVFFVGVIGLLLDRIMIVFQRLVSFDGAPSAL